MSTTPLLASTRPSRVFGHRGWRAAALATLAIVAMPGCNSSSTNTAGPGGTAAGNVPEKPGPETPVTVAAQGKPKRGGSLLYAVEADPGGFSATKSRWAISGMDIGLALFDPLVAVDEGGKPHPYLAEKMEPSADFTVWTFTLRKGVTFHNDAPLTSEAVVRTYKGHQASFLTGAAITNLDTVEAVDELTVKFTMKRPWATFPSVLVGQIGTIPAVAQQDMDNGGPNNPIGTGPFKLVEGGYKPDNVVQLERNPNYWRKDADGQQLPYLDKIEYRPVTENESRISGLLSGQFQLIHTSDGPGIVNLRERAAKGDVQKVEDLGESEEGFIMLNMAKPPFTDVRVRKAMAMGIDREQYVQGPGQGVNPTADGPFAKNSPWRTDTDYPKFDVAGATALVDEYEKEKGPITFTLRGGGPGIKAQLELIQVMLAEIGMDVQVETVEQTVFVVNALNGKFDANIWRQWGEVDPDQDYVWWYGGNAKPIGESSLNIGRNNDPKVDEALDRGRSSSDAAEREKAYADVQKQFAATLPYIWLDHSTWMIAAAPQVRGIGNGTLPDGTKSITLGGTTFPGTHRVTELWLAS